MEKLFAGLDLGGTKASVSIGRPVEDGSVQILERRTFPTGPDALPEYVLSRCLSLVKQLAPRGVDAAGVSCGGPLDAERKHICRPPNLPLWDNVPIVSTLEATLLAPAALQNDADACALAEWRCGAGRGCKNMIFLTFGTGLGAGLILNGALYTGACGMAGEAGHIRLSADGPAGYGKFGSFEGFCSGSGLAQLGQLYAARARQRGQIPAFAQNGAASAQDIASAAVNDDETALQVYEACGEALGRGLAVLVDLLNPERIVLGSIFVRAQQFLTAGMRRTFSREALGQNLSCCEILPAQLGEMLGDTAALCVAQEAFAGK